MWNYYYQSSVSNWIFKVEYEILLLTLWWQLRNFLACLWRCVFVYGGFEAKCLQLTVTILFPANVQ